MTFCLIGVKVCTKREVNDLEEKKVIVNNEEDDDNTAINLQMKQDAPEVEEQITEETPDLAAELENLKAELSAKDDRFLRLQADFDNFRKRTAREKSELAAVIEQAFLKDLLPLLDNLSRASEAVENADVESLRKGIEMIKQETVAVMGKHGLEPIDTLNKPFDPNYHQAVGTVKDETKQDGLIAAEFQRGYVARGRVIRPSMVQVVNNA